MTNFSKKLPLARNSTPNQPRSWWDKQVLQQATGVPAASEREKQLFERSETTAPTTRYPTPNFSAGPTKNSLIAKLAAEDRKRRAVAEAVAAKRLTPSNAVTDWLGKAYAAPLSFVGSVAGAANVAAARIAGDKQARISVGDNGIQFESGLLGDKDRAFTLGNAVLHGPGSTAEKPNNRYDGRTTNATTAEHESGHTYQYQHPGFIPAYLFDLARNAVTRKINSYEQEADDFSEWKHRQKAGGR